LEGSARTERALEGSARTERARARARVVSRYQETITTGQYAEAT
jgi:hypothetical protein